MSLLTSTSTSDLLGIPLESRLRIYKYHFSKIDFTICSQTQVDVFCPGCENWHNMRAFPRDAIPRGGGKAAATMLQLLFTNKQIRDEATPVMHAYINELFIINWGDCNFVTRHKDRSWEIQHGLNVLKTRAPVTYLKALKFSTIPPPVDWSAFPSLQSISFSITRFSPHKHVSATEVEVGKVITNSTVLKEGKKIALELRELPEMFSVFRFSEHSSLKELLVDCELSLSDYSYKYLTLTSKLVIDKAMMAQVESAEFDANAVCSGLEWTREALNTYSLVDDESDDDESSDKSSGDDDDQSRQRSEEEESEGSDARCGDKSEEENGDACESDSSAESDSDTSINAYRKLVFRVDDSSDDSSDYAE